MILTFACFVDSLLVSFQNLILRMICAINEKIETVAIYAFFIVQCKIVDDLCISFLTQSLSSPWYQRGSKPNLSFLMRVGHQWGRGDHGGRAPFHQVHRLHWRCGWLLEMSTLCRPNITWVQGFILPRFFSTNTQIILARIEKLTSLVCLRWETGGFQLVGRSMGCKELHPIHATWSQQLFFYFDIKFEIKDMIKVSDVPENRVWFASKNLT